MSISKPIKQKFKKELNKSRPIKELVKPFGEDAIKKFQKEISPKGVAAAEAAAKKALEEKYPGMFIPTKRTTPGVRRGR
jgi:hypothetical protein